MSMITGCPSCGTLFRVVPDQLRISEGWVRCGHCGEVFDAAAHLQQNAVLDGPEAAVDAVTQPDQIPAFETGSTVPIPPEADPQPESHGPADAIETAPAPLPVGAPAVAEPVTQQPAASPPAHADIEEEGYLPAAALRREAEVDVPSAADDDEDAYDLPRRSRDPLDDMGFVRQARRKAFWRRPLVRAGLVLLALALAALLAVQVGVQERDRLAASRPALRPWLESLCVAFDCQVRPPRRIEAIAIDSSGFIRVGGTQYRLTFTLKNQAQHAVAVPALELTLTDSGDQAVVRRVFLARELGAQAETIEAGADWSGSLGLALEAGVPGERITGYRLLAFYP